MSKTAFKKPSHKKRASVGSGESGNLKHYLELPYRIELVPLSESDGGGYLATMPKLPGCQSDGLTPDGAVKSLRQAQRAWLRSALRHSDPIPLPQ